MNLLPIAILAGGLATRLRPVTEKIPKALIDIDGEPFIAHQLRLLKSKGADQVVICSWYRGDMIQDYVRDGNQYDLKVIYSSDGPAPLGTGGAIKHALSLLGESFFVLYGDSYLMCDYESIQANFLASGKLGLMTVFQNNGQWDTSNVEFREGKIYAYDKKKCTSTMHYIDYGLGLFRQAAFQQFAEKPSFDLADVYQHLLEQEQLTGYEVTERFYEIGSLNGLNELRNLFIDLDLRRTTNDE